jgi:hypothetical protein
VNGRSAAAVEFHANNVLMTGSNGAVRESVVSAALNVSAAQLPLRKAWCAKPVVLKNGVSAVTALKIITEGGPATLIAGDDEGGLSCTALQSCSGTAAPRLMPVFLHSGRVSDVTILKDRCGFVSAGDDGVLNYVVLREGGALLPGDSDQICAHSGFIK